MFSLGSEILIRSLLSPFSYRASHNVIVKLNPPGRGWGCNRKIGLSQLELNYTDSLKTVVLLWFSLRPVFEVSYSLYVCAICFKSVLVWLSGHLLK